MKTFLLTVDGINAISDKTLINGKRIESIPDLRRLIKSLWCRETGSKSFQDWADSLNEELSGESETTYSKDHAIDNMANLITLNIDGKYVDLSKWWEETTEPKVGQYVLAEDEKNTYIGVITEDSGEPYYACVNKNGEVFAKSMRFLYACSFKIMEP
ncbi:MAG: hypothetical protein LBI60_06715 [Bacteroidales bacterium]|jgi:hypothetical protein|nr:hypothetical protein [Bacteroidales bacterium]